MRSLRNTFWILIDFSIAPEEYVWNEIHVKARSAVATGLSNRAWAGYKGMETFGLNGLGSNYAKGAA